MKLGFLGLLTLIFIVLKLVGTITWSWWLVFSPSILSFVIYISVVVGATIWLSKK